MNKLVVVKGGGDIATGIAHRLFRSGFAVVVTELAKPTVIRRTVSFAQAVYDGCITVEEVTAVKVSKTRIKEKACQNMVPVVVDESAEIVGALKPWAVVDAILAKKNTGTTINDAFIVIGVGPGFVAGHDVHAVVETMRGQHLGKVLRQGGTLPNTGVPGNIGGFTIERVLRAVGGGVLEGLMWLGVRACPRN